jgi:hypothetical protein
MKPRRDSAPLTAEDQEILANWSYSHIGDFWWKLPSIARDSDRRDADLIFQYEESKARYIAIAGVAAYWSARALGVELAMRAVR